MYNDVYTILLRTFRLHKQVFGYLKSAQWNIVK